jgi:hypothetical protein
MTLQDAPDTRLDAPPTHRFVPVTEAARLLGLSATTIRRRIAAGTLVAERVSRPQGTALLVQVPQDAPATSQDAPETPHDAPARTEQSACGLEAIIIGNLVATIERQAVRIGELEREVGQLRAEHAAHSPPASNLTPPARLGELRPWLLLAAILLAAGVVGWLR